MAFAEGTKVPPEKTRGEIEGLVRKYGATQFSSGWTGSQAGLTFVAKGVRLKFVVPLPQATDPTIRKHALRGRPSYCTPSDANLALAVAQEERRLWRCLLLAIKAKLETVQSGIATFEEEFLAHIVTDNGQTVFERMSTDPALSARMLPPIEAA